MAVEKLDCVTKSPLDAERMAQAMAVDTGVVVKMVEEILVVVKMEEGRVTHVTQTVKFLLITRHLAGDTG